MLDRQQLTRAIAIQSQSYQLLKWIGERIDKGEIHVASPGRHSDTPDAAVDWIEQNRPMLPPKLRPADADVREFGNFFWTYITSSFDVVANPKSILSPGGCGCLCPMCARISSASHLQAKKLTEADKRHAGELMVERVAALAAEEGLSAAPAKCLEIVTDPATRRSTAFSTYGECLINRLAGQTPGPAVLALWREIAWTRLGSPIHGFSLQYEDFQLAETALIKALRTGTGMPKSEVPNEKN